MVAEEVAKARAEAVEGEKAAPRVDGKKGPAAQEKGQRPGGARRGALPQEVLHPLSRQQIAESRKHGP